MKTRILFAVFLIFGFGAFSNITHAQDASALRIVVGFGAGGSTDGIARLLSEHLSSELNRPVVVENKPGALGVIAVRDTINARSDNPLFLISPFSSIVFPPITNPSVRYDIFSDLRAVASLTSYPLAVVAGKETNVTEPKGFVQAVNSNSVRPQFSVNGTGGHTHLLSLEIGELFEPNTQAVPYRGDNAAIIDVIGGHIPFGVVVAGSAIPYMEADNLNVVGVLSPDRSPLMPEIPTFKESGFDVDSGEAWFGMWTSSKTNEKLIKDVEKAVELVLNKPEVKGVIERNWSMSAEFLSGEATDSRLRADSEHWSPVIKANGLAR